MPSLLSRTAGLIAAGFVTWSSTTVRADGEPPCAAGVSRDTIVACAAQASLVAKAERDSLASFDGRARTASTVLPSNPVLSVTGGLPAEPGLENAGPLWAARLSQEIEIGGQRGVRRSLVERERQAQSSRVVLGERGDVAHALELYFDALAARDAAAVADRSSSIAKALRDLATGQTEAGVASPADALLADAVAISLEASAIEARQRVLSTAGALAAALGQEPERLGYVIEGELMPLSVAELPRADGIARALAERPEVAAANAEKSAAFERVRLLERTRLPNPSLAVAARNDWIDERSIGIELSLPIPVPSPIGQTNRGAIDEARALVERKDAELEQTVRDVRNELFAATSELATRRAQLELYDSARVAGAERILTAVTEEVAAKRLPLRDALIMQRALLDLLFARVEARRQLCNASVRLARASGQPFVTGATP